MELLDNPVADTAVLNDAMLLLVDPETELFVNVLEYVLPLLEDSVDMYVDEGDDTDAGLE